MSRPATETIHVLHVDDEPQFADLTGYYLEREDDRIEVSTATSASSGLDRLDESCVDCIVSDYEMPGKNGIEFLESVREDHPDLPFILFTGKGSEDVASVAISAGVTDYLQKEGGTDQYTVLANRITNAVERCEAERERRQWKRAVETANEGIAILDDDGYYVQMNDAYAAAYGRDPEELIGTRSSKLYPDEEAQRFEERVRPHLHEEGTWEGEAVARRRDGETYEQKLSLAALGDGGHVCVMQDITDRKEREQELQRYETIIEAVGDPVYALDADGYFTFVNDAWVESFGYDRDEIVGKHVSSTAPEEYIEEGREHIVELLQSEDRRTVTWELQQRTADGTLVPVENHIALLPLDDGEFQGTAGVVRDITKRKEREAQLRQNSARLEALFENSPDMINVHDIDGNIIEPNARLCEKTGYDEAKLTDMKVWELDETVDAAGPRGLWREMETGERLRTDGRFRRRDGSTFPVEIHLRRMNLDGEDRFVVISRDISERAKREQRLQRFETILETIDDAAFVVDDEWTIEYANKAARDNVGATAAEVDGQAVMPLVEKYVAPDEDPARFERTLERVFDADASAQSTERLELTLTAEDRRMTFEYQFSPLVENGETEAVAVTSRDVTGRKRHADELERYRRYTDRIFNAIDDLFFVYDETGTPQRWNESFTEVTSYSDDEVGSMHGAEFVPEEYEERAARKIEEVFETGHARLEAPILTKDGRTIPYEYVANRVEHPDGSPRLVGIGRDISERKAREEELERQNERLEEFASVVSHDLRNPLKVAEGRLELAREDCDSEHLDGIEHAHERMEALIDNLLTLAQDGKPVEDVEAVDLEELAETCWQTVETEAATLNVDTEQAIRADESRAQQLFENLFRNAVEHGGDDVTIAVGDLDGETGFYVADDGDGIPEDQRSDVFQSGYSTAEDGVGFGLSIVEGIAQAHGWDVDVTESEAGGARFEIDGVETAE